MPLAAKVCIGVTTALGVCTFIHSLAIWTSDDKLRFFFYLAVAGLSCRLKVKLPHGDAGLSVAFFFSLFSAVELGYSEAVVITFICTLAQTCLGSSKRPKPVHLIFNLSNLVISSAAAAWAFHWTWLIDIGLEFLPRVALATTTLFTLNLPMVAVMVALTQRKPLLSTLRDFLWPFPYYLAGGVLVSLFHAVAYAFGWQTALFSLPVVYLVYRSYQIYLDRLEAQRIHVEQMSALHFRTIEALARAIEAKDETTHEHLGRVQIYALEVGKVLGLDPLQTQALRAASLLHDIGKLAVPEFIINKPGKLTHEEFEKMKIHPSVGAQILETVQFPYPVVPIVRGHHEKWDGNGYPDGLKGEEIPIGARIIAAVDCLDALASDRQYRRALPLDKAMEIVCKESGRSFDPAIVAILQRNYTEYERKAKALTQHENPKLDLDVKITRGGGPAAGYEQSTPSPAAIAGAAGEVDTVAAAHEELWTLLAVIKELGPSLRLEETLALIAIRLRAIIPHNGFAGYLVKGTELHPVHVSGQDANLWASLRIPLGQGLSGWVADNRKYIVNGNPAVESGHLGASATCSAMASALAVPLENGGRVIGVVTLYATVPDVFGLPQVAILESICASLSSALTKRDSLRANPPSGSAALPAPREVFARLRHEVQRCQGSGLPMSVMIGSLGGFRQAINRFGEGSGERLLETVRQTLGQDGYMARLTGESFALVLPGVAADGAAVERVRQVVREAEVAVFGESLIALSLGVSSARGDALDCQSLLDAATHDLVRAKLK